MTTNLLGRLSKGLLVSAVCCLFFVPLTANASPVFISFAPGQGISGFFDFDTSNVAVSNVTINIPGLETFGSGGPGCSSGPDVCLEFSGSLGDTLTVDLGLININPPSPVSLPLGMQSFDVGIFGSSTALCGPSGGPCGGDLGLFSFNVATPEPSSLLLLGTGLLGLGPFLRRRLAAS